jgi:hypothetical protein
MEKIYLFLWMCALATATFAQSKYYYGIFPAESMRDISLDGKQTRCVVISYRLNFSPASNAGIQMFDLITAIDGEPVNDDFLATIHSKPHVVLSIKRLGNQTLDIPLTGIPYNGIPEALYAMADGEGSTKACVNFNLDGYEPIEIMSDPEADLYSYATFDFEFTGNNSLQQKEIAPFIEANLTGKGLKRNRDNPDMLIFIEYYSDKIEQYVPPNQNITTRYGTSYNVWTKRHESRQYVESYTTGDYTRVEYLSKLSIVMVDAKKMQAGGNGDFTVWQADYGIKHETKVNHKEFGENIGNVMLYEFPFKSVEYVEYYRYWFTGILYDDEIPGRVAGVIPDSPADNAGIKAGDVIKKCSIGNNKMFKKTFISLYEDHSMDGYSYTYPRFKLTRQYSFLANGRNVHNKSPFANTYMNYRYRFSYESDYTITDHDKKPPVFTVEGNDKKTRKVTVKPVSRTFAMCILGNN